MAVLTALFHAPFNAVGVRWRCRGARLVRPRKGITNEYALLFERTHGSCVPTSFAVIINDFHLMFQSHPFCHVMWPILHANLTLIAR